MIFLMDTCFALHVQELFNAKIFDFRKILTENFVGITESVKKEFIYYTLDTFLPFSDLIIIPINNVEFDETIHKYPDILELDRADQTLWYLGIAQKQEEYVILTDDGALFSECFISTISALRLPDFVLMLVNQSKIKKNIAAKCIKYWESQKRYTTQDLKYWINILQQIS